MVGVAGPSAAEQIAQAWQELDASLAAKPVDSRIAALNALSLLGGNARAEAMVRQAFTDPELDVQLAAMVAAGQMDKDRGPRSAFRGDLRRLLASDDPKISFTAATTLWAMHDPAGEDILAATAEGEMSSDYSLWKRSRHNASRTLHNPRALAKIAVQQGLVMLVPPVGMGMGAYAYLKDAPGVSPQITAIVQLSKLHTPAVQAALIQATATKNAGARTAAAEALADFPGPVVHNALYPLLVDEKLQVRLTASAALIRTAGGEKLRRTPRSR